MITTRFNANILKAARALQSRRTTATAAGDAGERYTSARLSDYQNHAIRRILLEELAAAGSVRGLTERLPWYVSTTPSVAVSGASTPVPADGWLVESVTGALKKFRHAPDRTVAGILAGTEKVLVPTAAEPVWWQEGLSVIFRPSLDAEVLSLRYIRRHVDLVVLDSPAAGGKINLAPGAFTAATRTLTVTMNVPFAAADVNKPFSFYDGTVVYDGFILSVAGATAVVAGGDALPAVNKSVVTMLVSDSSPGDVLLPDIYDPRIVAYMVEAALNDAKLAT